MLSDEDILKLYQDPNFPGSFSGVKNLRHFIKTDLNENVSEQRLYSVLKTLPNYIYQLKPIRKYPTRNYVSDSFGELMEIDLGFMAMFNKFRYFFVLGGCF